MLVLSSRPASTSRRRFVAMVWLCLAGCVLNTHGIDSSTPWAEEETYEYCIDDDHCSPGHRCLLPGADDNGTSTTGTSEASTATLDPVPTEASGGSTGETTTSIDTSTPELDDGFSGECSDRCEHELCPDRHECTAEDGTCEYFDCGFHVECLDSADYCYFPARTCYPASGQCDDQQDNACPDLDMTVGLQAECIQGFCRPRRAVIQDVPVFSELPRVVVERPVPDESFTPDAIYFRWHSPGKASIAFVLAAFPKDTETLSKTTLWGISVPAGSEQVIERAWSDGHQIVDGVWLDGPGSPPADTVLYFLVVLLDSINIAAISEPVAFFADENGLPSATTSCAADRDCYHPTLAMVCDDTVARCRPICLSHLDCAPDTCALPIPGSRWRFCSEPAGD